MRTWCELPHMGVPVPLVMISAEQMRVRETHGELQVLVQVHEVEPEWPRPGLLVISRYGYYSPLFNHGAIHFTERGLYGVSGSVQCLAKAEFSVAIIHHRTLYKKRALVAFLTFLAMRTGLRRGRVKRSLLLSHHHHKMITRPITSYSNFFNNKAPARVPA